MNAIQLHIAAPVTIFFSNHNRKSTACPQTTAEISIKSLSGLWNEARKACILLIHGGVVQARFWASPLPCR